MERVLNALLGTRGGGGRHYIPALDGLRGIAVVIVLMSHASNYGLWIFPTPSFSGSGRYGVYLFFVLSSFLLTCQLIARTPSDMENPHMWISYATRRITRILPLYFFVLVFSHYFADTGWVIPLTQHELIRHLALVQGSVLFWTIPVEFKFYLVLPVLAATYLVILKRRLLPAAILTCAVIAIAELSSWNDARNTPFTVHLGPYLPVFVCGSFAALVHYKVQELTAYRGPLYARIWEFVGISAALIPFALVPPILSAVSGGEVHIFAFHQSYILFGVVWSVVILGTLNGTGFLRTIACWAPFRATGIVSFSVYLWHFPVLLFCTFGFNASAGIKLLVFTVLTIVISIVSYRLVELPISKYRWSEKRPPSVSARRAAA